MKLFSLFPLILVVLSGCGDATRTDMTASNTDDITTSDAERYEANKPAVDQNVPVMDQPAMDQELDPAISAEPSLDSDESNVALDDNATPEQDEKTPFDQNENQADIDHTANIRSQITDTEMSVAAQNVEIVTQNGKVTLSGDVANQQEKDRIEEIAVKVAGEGNVVNQLKIDNE